jgi:iron complex outermembrane recepter protein
VSNRSNLGPLLVRASIASILGSAAMLAYVPAASAADEADIELEEIQVTGSRIVRRDNEANSPLVSVEAAELENRANLNIESYLNQLPQYNPAASPTIQNGSGSNSDVQISSVNSVGIAAISLRGFGPNRSLSLIEGRRAVPTNALMVVDINGIPSSMIKRVEIISGGASATYGADAIGGVSNFLLRRDFEGLETDVQFGTTQEGDGDELRVSSILGTKIGDGQGSLVLAAEYYDRKAAYERNHDFFTKSWSDPTVPGNFIGFVMGMNGVNNLFNPANAATLGAITNRPANAVYGFPGNGVFAGLRFNPNGTIFNPNANNRATFGKTLDGRTYSLVNAYDASVLNTSGAAAPPVIQQVKYNDVDGYVSSPQTRFAFMAAGDYDITDKIRFSSSARFAQSDTRTFLAGTNASFGWEATIPYNPATDSPVNTTGLDLTNPTVVQAILANPAAYANPGYIPTGAAGAQHPVPLQFALLLNSRAAPTAGWVLETFPDQGFLKRQTVNKSTAWQIDTGLTFDLPVKDFTGEVYYSRGESTTYNNAYGNNSLARWRGVVQSADYGRNGTFQSNANFNGPGASPGFGSVAARCTSGFYNTIFAGDARASDDCLYAVQASLQTFTANQQDVAELNFQGGLFDLPAGEVRTAFGYQYRSNSTQFNPDILQSTASFTDQVIGVYPTGYLDQSTVANDIYAEFLVPVVADLPFLKKAELELGGRQSRYNKTDDTTTFKINASLEFTDYLRLRGGFNRATRAPNLGEMFLNLQQIFAVGSANYGDPCGLLSTAPYGAAGAQTNFYPGSPASNLASGQTAAGATSAYLICRAQMTAAAGGAATAINAFYGSSAVPPTVAPPAAGGAQFAWVNQQGNPNLDSETADTWTAGIVFRAPSDSPLLSGLNATIDWYKINIDDAILPYSIDYARYLCYGAVRVTTAAEAAVQAASEACLANPRNGSNGGSVSTLLKYDNQATVSTSGIDFAINWSAELSDMGMGLPGRFGAGVQGTWLQSYKTKTSAAPYDPVIEWKGSLGPQLSGFNGGAYDYRLFTNLFYNVNAFNVSLRWRHLPSAVPLARASENAIKKNNAAVVAGSGGTLLSYVPTTVRRIKSYDSFDLTVGWDATESISVRAGITNLFDKDPPVTGASDGYPSGTNFASVCNGAPGCVTPTAYSLPNSGQGTTDGGYYDVMGRSFFLGVKARF